MIDRPSGAAQSDDVLSIGDLVQRQVDSGDSYRDLAERAARAGHSVSHQTFSDLHHETNRQWPKQAETILGVAAALAVSETAVVLGIAKSLGIPVSQGGPELARLLPAVAGRLTPAQVEAIRALIVSIVTPGDSLNSTIAAVSDDSGAEGNDSDTPPDRLSSDRVTGASRNPRNPYETDLLAAGGEQARALAHQPGEGASERRPRRRRRPAGTG